MSSKHRKKVQIKQTGKIYWFDFLKRLDSTWGHISIVGVIGVAGFSFGFQIGSTHAQHDHMEYDRQREDYWRSKETEWEQKYYEMSEDIYKLRMEIIQLSRETEHKDSIDIQSK